MMCHRSSLPRLKFAPHDVSSRPERSGVEGSAVSTLLATTDAVNLRMPDSVATRRHLSWLSFLAAFPLPEIARMSGRYRRYLLVLARQDMPSRIASTALTRVL